ncbi:MAG: quinone-dependent dihydroorotate dehydrogenase [Candidatus Moraniibacteriota bacterium]
MFHFLYVHIFRRIVFLLDPEKVHDGIVMFGRNLGKYSLTRKMTRSLLSYQNQALSQTVRGIHFSNPVGLSGGFDKNAELTDIIPEVGFGFMEIGSVTGEKCDGNAKPRLWRLKKSKSILVYYGLNNDGAEAIAQRLRGKKFRIPVGANIAKTNNQNTVGKEAGAADYLKAYKAMQDIADYFTINISCPNAYGGCPFTDKEYLDHLLSRLAEVPKTKPSFIKLSPDLSHEEIDGIIEVARKHDIDGFVCSNLTKSRNNPKIVEKDFSECGGMSGKVVIDLSNDLVEYIYRKTGKEFVLIGLGGIFSAEDAYKKIRLGATLVELITGMIFEGPQVIGDINQGLVKLLKKDGFKNISEAIGADIR